VTASSQASRIIATTGAATTITRRTGNPALSGKFATRKTIESAKNVEMSREGVNDGAKSVPQQRSWDQKARAKTATRTPTVTSRRGTTGRAITSSSTAVVSASRIASITKTARGVRRGGRRSSWRGVAASAGECVIRASSLSTLEVPVLPRADPTQGVRTAPKVRRRRSAKPSFS
jgi:hypothetical protein